MKPKLTIDGARQILTREKGTEPMLYHGGKRTNAGRKRGTPRKRVTIALSEPARQRLADIKRDTSKSYSAILEQLLTP